MELEWWVVEQKTHAEHMETLRAQSAQRPWAGYFLHDHPLSPGDLNSACRIGYVPFDRCLQDRFYCVDRSRNPEILAAGGITTQIAWDYHPENLPEGWQGSVRQAHADGSSKNRAPNTQVALLAFTTQRFRGKGLSGQVLSKMCLTAQQRGYKYLVVPALPPSQFEKEHVRTPIEEIAALKREDGAYYDYWVRVHCLKGADVIGCCTHSHRFAFTLSDFASHVSSDPITSTGEHVVRLDRDLSLGARRKNMWQLVYADIDRSFVFFNWGCVWVRYDLQTLKF